ncbi:MAG: hypothetical protein INF93_18685 [Rhodobacter sp.]|jgi:hypothetical protein|nr:hypothetical protein [Rhodobacter sp.]
MITTKLSHRAACRAVAAPVVAAAMVGSSSHARNWAETHRRLAYEYKMEMTHPDSEFNRARRSQSGYIAQLGCVGTSGAMGTAVCLAILAAIFYAFAPECGEQMIGEKPRLHYTKASGSEILSGGIE